MKKSSKIKNQNTEIQLFNNLKTAKKVVILK